MFASSRIVSSIRRVDPGSSAASVTFSAIPSTYTDLVVRVSARNAGTANAYPSIMRVRLNSDTSSLYSSTYLYGQVLCVIGTNGAGKSSLMRCVAGILPPSQGRIEVYGSVSTLLALGVGFNPSMSGRDNVFLGGLAAGMSREEIEGHFDEIADFSELGDAIDAPMRTYSSGMYARLAFSVAATVRPDELLRRKMLAEQKKK